VQSEQSALTLAAERWLFEQSLIDAPNRHLLLARHTARMANDAILRAIPTYGCTLSDFELQVTLALRFGWALPNVLPLANRCGHKRHQALQTLWHSQKCTKLAVVAIKSRHEQLVKVIKTACARLDIVAWETGSQPQALGSQRCPFDIEFPLPNGSVQVLDVTVTTPFEPIESVQQQAREILHNVHRAGKAEKARQKRRFSNTAVSKEHDKRTHRTDIPPSLSANGREPIWVNNRDGHRVCTNCLTAPELADMQCKSFSSFTLESCMVFGKDAWEVVDTLTKIAEEAQGVNAQHFKEGFLRELGAAMAKGNARCVQDAMLTGTPKQEETDWDGEYADQFDLVVDSRPRRSPDG